MTDTIGVQAKARYDAAKATKESTMMTIVADMLILRSEEILSAADELKTYCVISDLTEDEKTLFECMCKANKSIDTDGVVIYPVAEGICIKFY